MEEFKSQVRASVEGGLSRAFDDCSQTEVCRVARYATLGGGHRWRALVVIAAGRIFDPAGALQVCLPAACGIELAHAASLVLDDLPSMDDAQFRRGKPCAHHVFPAWAIDMAPVFMITLAYRIALANPLTSHERRVISALEMSRAGHRMIEGQELDVARVGGAESEMAMLDCYHLKSAALYGAAAKVGAITSGADDAAAAMLHEACVYLGLAYQFLDDVADKVAGLEEVGKLPGNDTRKWTAVERFGVEGASARARRYQDQALDRLAGLGAGAAMLQGIARQASWAPG